MNKTFFKTSMSILAIIMLVISLNCRREDSDWLPVLSTHPATGITSTEAVSGGLIIDDGGSAITARGVVWNTTGNPTIETDDGITTDGYGLGEYISLISGLSPSTAYYARAYATTAAGTSYGNTVQFATIDFALVSTSAITNITSISAVSGGNVEYDGGTEVSRGIVWATFQNPTIENNGGMTINGTGMGGFVSTMTGLLPLTTYYARAYAVNDAGTSYGDELQFATTEPISIDHDILEGSVEDIDGNIYKTVFIGSQEWMAENLMTTKYNDGSDIDLPVDGENWQNINTGAYAWYQDTESNKELFGAIYNWHAVVNPAKLCPEGWRVPSDKDWSDLVDFLAAEYSLSNMKENLGAIGNRLKSCRQVNSLVGGDCATSIFPRWHQHYRNYGFDDFGFAALPIGSRNSQGEYIPNAGHFVQWWSTTENNPEEAFIRYITFDTASLFRMAANKLNGYAVRCVR